MDFTLCLTHACNMRCSYCYAVDKRASSMTWKTAKRAIDCCLAETLSRSKLRQCRAITQLGFFGGEPLLEWKLLQRATEYTEEECSRLDILLKKTVTTNMSLLDEEKASWLKDHRFQVALSLDGAADRHNLLRRMADGSPSHANCAGALQWFRGKNVNSEMILVVDPHNISGLADSVQWLVDQEMFSYILSPNYNAVWSEAARAQWQVEIERIGIIYQQCFRDGRPIRIDIFDSKIEAHIANPLQRCGQCSFGGNQIAVAPDGRFYPCVRIVGLIDRAGMEAGDVSSGIDSRRLARLAPTGSVPSGECNDCLARPRCKNWCACVNHATTGNVDSVSGLVCYHERMTINIADQVAATLFAEKNPAFLSRFYR